MGMTTTERLEQERARRAEALERYHSQQRVGFLRGFCLMVADIWALMTAPEPQCFRDAKNARRGDDNLAI